MTKDRSRQEASLPEEIHRRGLWQAAVGYLAVGWALIEVVDVLVDRRILPESVFGGALVVLLLGFPVILATAYVQTPPRGGGRRASDEVSPRAGIARHLTWRNAILGGVGAFALLGVLTAATTVLRVADVLPEDGVAIEADRVAVFPFTIRGAADLDYLGEGIVDLVSAKLDGAGSLTAADPRAVIAGASSGDFDVSSPEDAHALAAELGAGRFVTGELIESRGTVRLTATLRQTHRPEAAAQAATVEGTAHAIFAVLDRLVAELLAEVLEDEGDRLQGLAAVTTPSIDAAKEYLRGERLLRAARYREAGAAYERALEIDSTFALAHYRRSIAADWIDAFDIRSSADHAMRYSGQLSSREQDLLRALSLRRNGRFAEAEQVFRAILHSTPNDVEALVQYAELLFHDIARQGRSIRESLAPFRRAVDLEPNNLIAHQHLARLYAVMDSTARLSETSRIVTEADPDGERTGEVAALEAYVLGDTALQRSVLERLRGSAWYYWWYSGHSIGNFARDTRAAEDLLSHRDIDAPFLQMLDLTLDVMRGRHDAVRQALRDPAKQKEPNWQLYEAFLLTSGALDAAAGRASSLADELAALSGDEILRGAWIPPNEDLTPRLEEYQAEYFRALLLLRAGRTEVARSILDALQAEDGFEGTGSVKQDAERALQAELRLAEGDRDGALNVLRSMEYRMPHALISRPMSELSGSRLLRGRLEYEMGDMSTAETFLLGLDESWSPWDAHLRPEAYALLGRIAEDTGRVDEAIAYYTRLADLWADADPALAPRREEIEARRDVLLRARG